MFDPLQTNALMQPGMMHTMSGGHMQFPLNFGHSQQAPNALQPPVRPERPQFDMSVLKNAMQGMQHGNMNGMPQSAQDAWGQFQDYRTAMGQYRDDMRDYRQQPHGPMMHGSPIPGAVVPGMPNTQFPLNSGLAAPGVGQSLNVRGMMPGSGAYGMPTY